MKYRIAAFLVVNPFLAMTVGAFPAETQELILNTVQGCSEALHHLIGVIQPRQLVLVK